jgi:small subunit ribosomal protein S6
MAQPKPTYDLMLLLDPSTDADQRKKILADTEAAVGRGGEVVSKHDWGQRAMAYEIHKTKEAEYHLLQFHAGAELLEQLDRTLRITDGVTRFRIIKLAPGTPAPPARPAAGAEEPAPAAAPVAAPAAS